MTVTETRWLTNLNPGYLTIMLLMAVRIGALLLTTPAFGARTVPAINKIGFAIILSFVLLPTAAQNAILPPTFGHLIVAMGKETLIGLLAGFAVTLVFSSLQVLAALAGVQIGFGFSNTVDINYGGQSPVLDHLFTGMATLIFFTGNFHHQFLIGANGLFSTLPPNSFSIQAISPEGLLILSANIFLVATRMALPLIGALLLTDIAMGLMARTSPQFNVFYVGMPIKVALGIFALVLMLPFVVTGIETLFGRIAGDIDLIVRYR